MQADIQYGGMSVWNRNGVGGRVRMGKGIERKEDDRGGSGKTPFVNFSIFVFFI